MMSRSSAVDTPGVLLRWAVLAACSVQAVLWSTASGQEETSPSNPSKSGFQKRYEEARRYEIRNDKDELLTLHPKPLMNWANPERRNNLGSIFVWESEGRPAVVGTVFTYEWQETVRWKLALHSLADGPLSAAPASGALIWSPPGPGITWQTFPDSPASAPSKSLRLVQMRSLARKFQVTLTDREGKDAPLRLLPQPVWRYSSPAKGIEDGAIFGWVVATDPEAFLLIELTDSGEWQYAFARFHFWRLRAVLGGEPVWEVAAEMDQMRNTVGQKQFQSRPYSTMVIPGPE